EQIGDALGAGLMALGGLESGGPRPAPVAVEHHAHMLRQARTVQHFGQTAFVEPVQERRWADQAGASSRRRSSLPWWCSFYGSGTTAARWDFQRAVHRVHTSSLQTPVADLRFRNLRLRKEAGSAVIRRPHAARSLIRQ